MSHWIGQVDHARQPRNAVTVMFVFGAVILCTILPSQVAFYSLISAGGIPTTAAYGLIALLRLTMTPNDFKGSHFYLGKYRKPFYAATVFFNAIVFSVRSSRRCDRLFSDAFSRSKSLLSSSQLHLRPSTSYVQFYIMSDVYLMSVSHVHRLALSLAL